MSAFDVLPEMLTSKGDTFAIEAKQPWAIAVAEKEGEEAKKETPIAWSTSQTQFQQLFQQEPVKSGEAKRTLRARNFVVPAPTAAQSRLSGKRGAMNLVFHTQSKDAVQRDGSLVLKIGNLPITEPIVITKATLTSFDCGEGLKDPLLAGVYLRSGDVLVAATDSGIVDVADSKESRETGVLVNLRKSESRVLSVVQTGESTAASNAPHIGWISRLASLNVKELSDRIDAETYMYDGVDGPLRTDFVRVRLQKEPGAVPVSALQFFVITEWHRLASKTVEAIQAIADEKQRDVMLREFSAPETKDQPAQLLVHKLALLLTIRQALARAGRQTSVVDPRSGFSLVVTKCHKPSAFDVWGSAMFTVCIEYAFFAHPEHVQVFRDDLTSSSSKHLHSTERDSTTGPAAEQQQREPELRAYGYQSARKSRFAGKP